MKIYRTIQTDNLDYQNIGCHWTSKKKVAQNCYDIIYGGNSDDFDENANIMLLQADIDSEIIDINASLYSRCDYPTEFEVVLLPNQNFQLINGGKVNSGNRRDDWIEQNKEDINNIDEYIELTEENRKINKQNFFEAIEEIRYNIN